MLCDYTISTIVDLGNKVRVVGMLYEGDMQDVITPDPQYLNDRTKDTTVNQYVRTKMLAQAAIIFEHSPATDEEIRKELKRSLEDIKQDREIIPSCL